MKRKMAQTIFKSSMLLAVSLLVESSCMAGVQEEEKK